MTNRYVTSTGDVLDDICWKEYGRTTGGVVERVLDANAALADAGPVLPAGLVIVLPALPAAPVAARPLRLWG